MNFSIRKLCLLVGLILFSVPFFSFAEEILTGVTISSGENGSRIADTKLTPEIVEYKQDVREAATVRFCNDGKIEKNIISSIKPGESKEICLYFKNDFDQNVVYELEFIGGYTDQDGSRYCLLSDNPGDFPKFIEKKWDNKVYVKKRSTVIKKFNVKFPIGVKGGVHQGCIGYSIGGTDFQASSLINVRFRKVNYLDFLVGGEAVIESVVKVNGLTALFDKETSKLTISGAVENIGSLDQIVDISGSISNIFGYKKTFSFSGINLPISASKSFSTKELENILDMTIPFYKGLYNIDISVSHRPYFSFDISNSGIDPKIMAGGQFDKHMTIFLFPWTIIGMFVLFLFLIWAAFLRKPKVVYVDRNAQNIK